MSTDATIFWRSAVPTAIVGAILVVLGWQLYGVKGVYAGLIAVGLVTVFFAISVIVVSKAAKISPSLMMGAALGTYAIKVLVLAALAFRLRDTTSFNGRFFGISAIICVLVWSATQFTTMMRLRIPYVEPARPASEPAKSVAPGGPGRGK
jgi:ATP synthase protein I